MNVTSGGGRTYIFDCETLFAFAVGTEMGDGPVFLTFAPWAAQPPSQPWGLNFFVPRSIPVIAVVGKQNHWWHTAAIWQLADVVRKHVASRPLILYGTSLGAYGALHLRNAFDAAYGFAIAPQVSVSPEVASGDGRWLKDRALIELQFDELSNLRMQRATCCVFLDPFDASDRYQYELHSPIDKLDSPGGIALVPIPHFTHGAAIHLARSKLIAPLLVEAARGRFPDVSEVRPQFGEAYKLVPKPFFNYLRRSEKILERDVALFRQHLDASTTFDYEAAYMASEVFLKLEDRHEAMKWSDRSIVRVLEQYGRISSDAACKHLRTLKRARGIEAARAWWEPLDNVHKSAAAEAFYRKYIIV
ncbi:hypothetical protein [Methylobacterium oxalidis]|uniref:Alpha/beta hydrolase n=1 Tax=Methylobacterium oxalidis TaxID=944322 RepID=A0A512JBN3_9HYPH|nr:hypothetical protein [Methylobacterium oxalidis]GEP07368.1 hypothetical protein MOX02_54060 [Methylobacterium oxalidis]GJE33032.1 hypothetical protein LDDCCGHA_3231 [Methylobacterium oxalidis]GLS64478.1 hypothetical protein GCM10007888_28590 [Methylobacterium oxalidis]